jgi:hypothetical protein
MKNRKPFKGLLRRMAAGGAASDEPDETGTFRSGVRLGRHSGISDDVRRRAVDRMEAQRTLKALADERPAPAAKPTPKPTPRAEAKPAPRAEAKPAPRAEAKPPPTPAEKPAAKVEAKPAPKRDNSVPTPEAMSAERERVRRLAEARRPMDEARDRVSKGMAAGVGAAGALAGAYGAGRALTKAAQAARAARQQASDVMRRAGERATAARARKQAQSKMPERKPPRDADEERMSGEGGAFRKGGSVRGDGRARKGHTKGKMR